MLWKLLVFPAVLLLVSSCSVVNSQNCGIVGEPSGTLIELNVSDSTPVAKEIWRAATFEVNGTVALSHPHAKYISALRYTSSYTFSTSNKFPDFIAEQGHVILTRNVTFICKDGGRVTYDFEILLEISDKEKPKFLNQQYNIEITPVWPLYDNSDDRTKTSINQGQIIIVGDSDDELVDASLTFSTNLKNDEEEIVIQVIGTPLWPDSGPLPSGRFFYNVDMYLNKTVGVGDFEFFLSAQSRMQSGSTVIKLTVK